MKKLPEMKIGQAVRHPSISYKLEITEPFLEPEIESDYIKLGRPSTMVYKGKVRCSYTDTNGVYHNHLILPVDELTVLAFG